MALNGLTALENGNNSDRAFSLPVSNGLGICTRKNIEYVWFVFVKNVDEINNKSMQNVQ